MSRSFLVDQLLDRTVFEFPGLASARRRGQRR
jgi:hypothetical protein